MNRVMTMTALALVYVFSVSTGPQAQGVGVKIEIGAGSTARYRIGERLAGINFNNEAVGTTQGVTGAIVLKADGSIDSSQSKIVIDMKSLSSDQALRDMYVQSNVLQTAKFPTLEFVPTKAVGLPNPLPAGTKMPNTTMLMPVPAGFQLTGNMLYRGVTREVTWNVVTTINADTVSGRATTKITFAAFNITKPSVPLIASVEDDINLELDFRAKRFNTP